eukprot:CAMPEP_0176091650 /NCGR_PEP_ID=MMETSP0120_2-20121206/45908_1 /TAXON_ID=160619 /ORGANISM="Kryptoperidinium foliaceum, Strain CCMP 1326" /LENGTH=150 /DNA_ID=CAMNT_0017425549 /DNA_START=62 /DNA_END=514 /DNA_ORIENTATION=-
MALPKPAAMKASRQTAMRSKRAGKSKKIARGRVAKAMVLRGSREKTSGGLKSGDLMKNKRGKVVSKRQSAQGRRAYSLIEGWTDSVMEARRALHITSGFVAINGKTLQGKALYVKAKALYTTHGKRVHAVKAQEVAPDVETAESATLGGA